MNINETYNDKVVRQFAIMTIVWGIVGMAVGVLIAAQLYWPLLNFDVPWLTYSRLRPLHTNAVIFAFGGSALIATSYYVVQRTCHVRLFSDRLAAFTFWGWQAVIVGAALTLPLGITQGKEYAELEWPIDLLITVVWVAYAVVFFTTIARRRVSHIYVANWFYAAFIITIAVLHVFNNLAIPVSLTKSYVIYSGAIDAMMQWWYGHNAVGFFLTAGFLGMMSASTMHPYSPQPTCPLPSPAVRISPRSMPISCCSVRGSADSCARPRPHAACCTSFARTLSGRCSTTSPPCRWQRAGGSSRGWQHSACR
jgi:cytochrome c oxidase cbb3-type subunit 1